LHVAFIHIETPGDVRGTDASPFQGSVKARGKGASQATAPTATLKVLDGLSMLIHFVEVSQWCSYSRRLLGAR
jgi:hypothetical protein